MYKSLSSCFVATVLASTLPAMATTQTAALFACIARGNECGMNCEGSGSQKICTFCVANTGGIECVTCPAEPAECHVSTRKKGKTRWGKEDRGLSSTRPKNDKSNPTLSPGLLESGPTFSPQGPAPTGPAPTGRPGGGGRLY